MEIYTMFMGQIFKVIRTLLKFICSFTVTAINILAYPLGEIDSKICMKMQKTQNRQNNFKK